MAAATAATLLIASSTAHATSCEAPPGTAGIDQYCETIPGATGDRGAGDPHGGLGVPPATRSFLARNGAGAVVQLATPSGVRSRSRDSGKHGRVPTQTGPAAVRGEGTGEPSRNPLDAVRAAFDSGDSVGAGLTWALLAVALVLAGAAWVRYRSLPSRD